MKISSILNRKKGISEMVSYVLLVVIAIGISITAYSFLKSYVPKGQTPNCLDDVAIQMQDYVCDSSLQSLTLTISNTGLHSFDAVYIRMGDETAKVRSAITPNRQPLVFGTREGLKPGETYSRVLVSPVINSGKNILEIQPAMYTANNKLAACDKATVTYTLTC